MKVVVLGGTGTLGRALTERLLEDPGNEVVCFSRCELKQKQMEADFRRNPRLSFKVGDIRDARGLARALRGVDAVFACAALKHVDTLEANPEESVKTNILGTINIADACEQGGVKYCAFSSTDKAVEPINVYGMSKGISERILLARNGGQTRFSVFRWGNVLFSRGAALHKFFETLEKERTAYVTDLEMTRFWIRIEDAISFMLANYQTAQGVQIPPIKAAPVTDIIRAIAEVLGIGADGYAIRVIGVRPGEKLHETLDVGMRSDAWVRFGDGELTNLIAETLGYCRVLDWPNSQFAKLRTP